MVIAYDSKRVVAIVSKDDDHFEIQSYSLKTYELEWECEFSGKWLKMNVIDQNSAGNVFVVPYSDNGTFYLSVINSEGQELANENVSEILKIDDKSKPIIGFYEPLITACVLPNQDIFVAVYHRLERKQYHFLYSYLENKAGDVQEVQLEDCSKMNFPIKSFYSEVTLDCLTFYRQGQCITVKSADMADSRFEHITNSDFGSMYLLFDQALIVRSSSSILFFKICKETGLWTQYHELKNIRGQIYFIKGNVRIQVVTDEKIYFFMVDKDTFKPTLENCMNNFMNCSMMMFGKMVRYGITYKTNQPGFVVYTRQSYVNFKVAIQTENYEGSNGINLSSINSYAIAHGRTLEIFDEATFESKQNITVPNDQDIADLRILYITKSDCDNMICVALGLRLIKEYQDILELVVYKKGDDGLYSQVSKCEFNMHDACSHFVFNKANNDELLFTTTTEVIKFNYHTLAKETHFKFRTPLGDEHPPSQVCFCPDQKKFIVATHNEVVYVDIKRKLQIDIAGKEDV